MRGEYRDKIMLESKSNPSKANLQKVSLQKISLAIE
jgi:hypothetical protein